MATYAELFDIANNNTLLDRMTAAVAWLFAADSWPAVVEAVVRRFRGLSPISVSRQNQVTYGRFNQRSQT